MSNYHIPIPPPDCVLEYIKKNIYYRIDGTIVNKNTLNILGTDDGQGYLRTTILGKTIRLHHIVWFLCKGKWPELQLDHKDRVKINNRITNLQEAIPPVQQNNKNITAKSGLVGAYRVKNGYQSQIWKDNKRYICGFFKTKEEAHEAYKTKYKELWGTDYIK